MLLRRLALAVRDEQRSRDFYEAHFGFGAREAQRQPDGALMLYDAEGFALALGSAGAGAPAPPPVLHFGFTAESPEEVRHRHERLHAAGVPIVETADEPDHVSVKCRDPDGYVVEVSWEREG